MMRALSVRQPFAELILRGVKTVEYRSRPTHIIGEPFYIYASMKPATAIAVRPSAARKIWSRDLSAEPAPAWMLELGEQLRLIDPRAVLPMGLIVGTAVIEKCVPADEHPRVAPASGASASWYAWHLGNVQRIQNPKRPRGRPQPVWFNPF